MPIMWPVDSHACAFSLGWSEQTKESDHRGGGKRTDECVLDLFSDI